MANLQAPTRFRFWLKHGFGQSSSSLPILVSHLMLASLSPTALAGRMPSVRYYLLALLTLTTIGCAPATGWASAPTPRSSSKQAPKNETAGQVAQSHIEANAPSQQDFEALLLRDLSNYLAPTYGKDVQLDLEMLRHGPTQSGVSYPKYYVWVIARPSSGAAVEGAARVAGIETTKFEVTDFLTAEQIVSAPTILATVFPEVLRDGIVQRARKARGL